MFASINHELRTPVHVIILTLTALPSSFVGEGYVPLQDHAAVYNTDSAFDK